MLAQDTRPKVLQFGVFELNLQRGELRKQGVKVKLQDQPLKVLQFLLENPGQIVTREQLRAHVWPADTFVEFDQGLYSAMARLRDTLGDASENPRFIQTVSRRGYKFIAPVTLPVGESSPGITPKTEVSRWPWVHRWTSSVLAGLLGGALLLVVVFGFDVAGAREWLRSRISPIRSLAVLPLQNLSNDPQQDYFADGMTDELITELAEVGNLRVISRTSAMSYKNTKKTLPQIARELNVDAVLEGSVVRSGDRVRITAQLIQAEGDRHIWAHSYERDLRNVLVLQGEIAHDIVGEVRANLRPTPSARQVNPESYEAYLQGRYFWSRRGLANFQKAIGYYQQAIQIDPEYAAAYAGLADAYSDQGFWGGTPNEAIPKAKAAALRALELDDSSSEAHSALAGIADGYDWDWTKGETEHRRALELNPNNAVAHLVYASHLVDVGQREKAGEEVRKAQSLDPLSPFFRAAGGLILYLAGYREEGIQQNLKAIELAPDFLVPHLNLSQFYFDMGNYDQGILEYEKGSRLAGMPPATLAALLDSYKSQGISGFRREQLKLNDNDLLQLDSFSLALIHAGLGEKEKAIQYLQQNLREHGAYLQFIGADSRWDSLRGEPQFQTILREMHFRQ